MITVCVIDSSVRARDMKEMLLFRKDKDIRFVMISTRDGRTLNHKYIPHVKQYVAHGNLKEFVMDVCQKEKVDVIHSHNFPDVYGEVGIWVRNKTGIRIVHEVHDIAYENTKPKLNDVEKFVMNNADELICVSEPMVSYIDDRYPSFHIRKKTTVIYSYPNARLLPLVPPDKKTRFIRAVYQGGILSQPFPDGSFNHRYYKDIFTNFTKRGFSLDVYPASIVEDYRIPGVVFKKKQDVSRLYKNLAGYDFGFLGYNRTSSAVMDMAMPNKLFEYIGCGLPVLSMPYDAVKKFLMDTKMGIVTDDDITIPDNFDERMQEARRVVLSERLKYTMETQKNSLFSIYQRLAGG